MEELYPKLSLEIRADFLNKGLGVVRPIFLEPRAELTQTPRLPGTDGRKMSKSYNNAIYLSDPPEAVSKKVADMMTDPARKRRTDKGNPDVCPVYAHHRVFSAGSVAERVNHECRTAEIGCVECKMLMAENLNRHLDPIREGRKAYERDPQVVWDILDQGTEKARNVARETMDEVRHKMHLAY
jgi:tryptophanyl-tRNA synthetase